MGCTSSPDCEQMYMPSSSVTFRQFQPSAANSTALRSAFSCNSCRLDHMRLLIRSEYSYRVGIGITSTSSWNMIRVFLGLISPLVAADEWLSAELDAVLMPPLRLLCLWSSSVALSGSVVVFTPCSGLRTALPSGGSVFNVYPTPIPRSIRSRRSCAAVGGGWCTCTTDELQVDVDDEIALDGREAEDVTSDGGLDRAVLPWIPSLCSSLARICWSCCCLFTRSAVAADLLLSVTDVGELMVQLLIGCVMCIANNGR